MAALLLILAAAGVGFLGNMSPRSDHRGLRDRDNASSVTAETEMTPPLPRRLLLGEETNNNDAYATSTTLEMVQSNIALGKVATQSTTCFYGDASRAVDGDTNPRWQSKTISHTCGNWNQWWRVELGSAPSDEVAIIFGMIFHGRDSFQDRMSDAVVEVHDSSGEVVASRSMGDMTGVVTKELDFGNVKGSAVKISSPKRTAITIAELEVMGAVLCPTDVGTDNAMTIPAGRVTLGSAGKEGKLCTLTKVMRNNVTEEVATIIPMARSYDFQEWSNAAGEVPAVAIPDGWNCHTSAPDGSGSATYCMAQLPELAEDEEYVLTSFNHTLPERDQVARLLETATYGPTPEDLAEWDFSTPLNLAMSAWVAQQMDPIATPMTSHREFWRLRANAPTWGSVSVGPAGDPCTTKSRWRKVAYGTKEYSIYRRGVIKTVEPILDEAGGGNVTRYLVSVHGQPRTVISEAQKDLGGNPPVNFTGFEHLAPNTLYLPEVGEVGEADKLQPLDGGYLLETPVASLSSSSGLCSLGLPRLEYNHDAIVGHLPDGEWVLFDAVLEQRTNTLHEPLTDGGGFIRNVTGGEVLCANVPRTFLNGQSCQMSSDDDACTALGDDHGGVGTLVCGSPGEPSNDVSFSQGDSFYYAGGGLRFQNPLWVANTRRDTWSHISIFADDQLRQRMAFALSQIFPVVISDGWYKSENFVNYYDIFVRNAFGNFRTLLKEVSYSPMMATTLTYMQSKSQAFVKKTQKQFSLADENFAREIMQLFTIGTVLLNIDGTMKRDPASGNEIEAYSNLNVMNFARAWTGFDRQESRGNIEDYQNNIDPMRIEAEWRDKFPIFNLDGGYIGDHAYPLCEDLPPKMFLTKGAAFRFLGRSKMPETMNLNTEYLVDESMVEVELTMTSPLRALLCSGAGQDCKSQPPRNEIILSETLSCADGTIECDIDSVRVVKVADGRYWEYVRPPCVEQAFYEGGKKLALQRNDQDGVLCANPRLSVAFDACCEIPATSAQEVCEQCFDGNPCTEDMCSENGQCFNPPLTGCSNGAFADYWRGAKINGYDSASDAIKNDPRYPKSPDETKLLSNDLSLDDKYDDWYGARLRTYIVPPASDNYTFYVKGDDVGELWLSSDGSSAGLGQDPIAFFTSWTSSFDAFLSQKSQPIHLLQGQVYYLEAFMIEMRGSDNLAIAWESSGAGIPREIIPAKYTQQSRKPAIIAHMHNLYDDERVTYDVATNRCEARDARTCDYSLIDEVETPSHKAGYHWTDVPCQILIKVTDDKTLPGWIAIVHNTTTSEAAAVAEHVDESSENLFPAVWDDPTEYPRGENLCGGLDSSCQVLEDGSGCLCATAVSESVGYDAMPPSVDHALSRLFIGAIDPYIFQSSDEGYETELDPTTGIVAHKRIGSNGMAMAALDQATIFEVRHERTGRTFFLKNVVSTVNVVGTSYSFRNAPHFLSLVPTETDLRDAQYQTDAVLDHYFYHENTAPFLARMLIQRFNVASNPSPAYVKAVATAFQKGLYSFEDTPDPINTSGSGEYGDLAATVSAILLHPEARSPTLDADPSSGSVRQPLMKIIAVLRALGLQTNTISALARIGRTISEIIGQGPHDFTTIFSHFLADFQTTGRGGSAGLFAPEEMVLDLPRITRLLNGIYGTIFSWGFNSRYGFGSGWSGKLSLVQSPDLSATDVVDEFATLLTAGRLSTGNRALIADAYQTKFDSTSPDSRRAAAEKYALELVTSSAEFHSTNIVTMSGKDRFGTNDSEAMPPTSSNANDYKAVIFLNLGGGVDSFNMLVPHTCMGTEGGKPYEGQTLDEQYQSIRGIVALDKDSLHQIDSGTEDQPCSVFGLHPSLPFLASLYDEEDALFVANAGYMSDPDFTKTVGHVSGHSSMSHYAAKVDAFSRYGDTGVLGRMRDVLISSGEEKTSAISINGGALSVVGQGGRSSGPVSVGIDGVADFPKWVDDVSFLSQVKSLNNATATDSGFMAELWSSKLHHSMSVSGALREGLEAASLATPFALNKFGNPLGEQLKMVSRLQQVNAQRGITRDFYNVYYGSFDHHGGLAEPLDSMFKLVDEALNAYVTELKALNLWESTVLVETSEFARTLYPNGNAGTDHGWGGHYFVIGGPVKGGRIIGKYPRELREAMKAWGRRVVPTTPWDSIWGSVAEWMGIDDAEGLKEVCPNLEKFESETLFNAAMMFTPASCTNSGGICTTSANCCSQTCHGDGYCL